jgi:hypothetical protein
MSKPFQVSLAPQQLWQAINPWTFYQQGAQFGVVNIELGQTPAPETERAILDEVGSYGRQLGRIGDALGVLLAHVKLDGLSPDEKDTLDILRGQLAEVRQVKQRVKTGVAAPAVPAVSSAPVTPGDTGARAGSTAPDKSARPASRARADAAKSKHPATRRDPPA